ncbi:MAG TPA: sigma 54-interacting transcriptional regulator [Kofleriaceae bacterium]|nr:sigma 54-interacting transcriptional regulator [Kofleriaceae bacterium]
MNGERTLSYADDRSEEERSFVAPYLVVALECERPMALPVRLSLVEVDRVAIGRGDERSWRRLSEEGNPTLRIALPDGWMSSRHATLTRVSGGGWMLRDEGSKNGTFVNGRPAGETLLCDGDLVEAGSTLLLFRDRVRRSMREAPDLDVTAGGAAHPALLTLSFELSRALAPLARLAPAGVSIVIGGESGTGKELTARAIHDLSARPGPFVALNCGALPETLVEGELFGVKRGAFSGAAEDRLGLVRAAHRGTLFLDEIADLPPGSQVKLLRVLQEGEVTPLGATQPVAVDVRVLAASHRSLAEMVERGGFRADLYARLAGAHVALPPLRQRREDIGLLVAVLLGRLLGPGAEAVRLEREAARALFLYPWPNNIRELEQTLRAAVALASGLRIAPTHLPEAVRGRPPAEADQRAREELVRLLAEHGGNISAVARAMGKARVQIRRWCRRFGIDPDAYRPEAYRGATSPDRK